MKHNALGLRAQRLEKAAKIEVCEMVGRLAGGGGAKRVPGGPTREMAAEAGAEAAAVQGIAAGSQCPRTLVSAPGR